MPAKKYATQQERVEADRARQRARYHARGGYRATAYSGLLSHYSEEEVPIPPEVKRAQRKRVERLERALQRGLVTANQWWLGEPARRRFPLSRIEVEAILGVQ